MNKKLSEEKIITILETGIAEFAIHGLDRANINVIAKKSGVSVGVLYKYFENKDAFFIACLSHSLKTLQKVLNDAISGEEKALKRAEKLVRAVQSTSRDHAVYNIMYNEITAGACQKYAKFLAQEIESMSAEVYTNFISGAMQSGEIRDDIDPRLFSFFFDNMLLTMQFSYSCDYYKERFKIFCGDDIFDNDEKVVSEFLKFIESAFTFKQSDIVHGK